MSLFKKPKRNFRRKNFDLDESEQNENLSVPDGSEPQVSAPQGADFQASKPKIEKVKKKDKEKDKSKKTVLSFEDEEEEEEVFKVKKSSTSRRIAKQMKKEKKERERDTSGAFTKGRDSNGNGMVDSDDETSHSRDQRKERRNKKSDEDSANALKKLREELRIMNGEEAEAAEESGDDDDGDGKTFKKMLARGEIPDANMIHYIRKQRQMARETDNFIPIEEPEEKEKPSKVKTARLVRDDDNDKSDDDEEERVDFSINNAARDRQKLRDNFLAQEHGSDSDSDQEREWEQQQIRKGASLQIPGVEVPQSNEESTVHFYSSTDAIPASSVQETKSFSALSSESKSIDIETVRKRLQERLDGLQSVNRTHKIELERIVTDCADTRESNQTCETEAPLLEARFKFFQELRGYVRDLIDCLNEKVPALEQMERGFEGLLTARAQRLLQRRQQDVIDQDRECMINKSSVKLDAEAGGEAARQRRAAEREARRARRRRAREGKGTAAGHNDGGSSDDEESSQSLALKHKAEMDALVTSRDELLEDVVEDFSSMVAVRTRFESWRAEYGPSYTDAYIGLCLPKLLNPFVRREMLLWNPLEAGCPDFEDCTWFTTLLCMGGGEGSSMDKGDDDLRILPALVEKVLLPRMTFLVKNVWDPVSSGQTTRLVALTRRLARDYPSVHAKSKTFRQYLEAVVKRMNKTLEDDVFIPRYPLNVLDNRTSGPAVFFHRQAWMCIKLLGNLLAWHGLVSTPVLQRLALSGLLNRYLVVGLVCSHINREALCKCQAILACLPRSWFADLPGEATLPGLENLCRYLTTAASTLEKATLHRQPEERMEARELVKQMSKLLVQIHALDHAATLANQFSFKLQQV